jgi:RNA 2',3'-cyclic 3'-phosphodiesterase
VNRAASLGSSDRLRLFVALCLPPGVVDGLVAWQERELAGAPGVRRLSRDHLHITLAFLGGRPAGERSAIEQIVRQTARESAVPTFHAHTYRETARVGMVVLAEEPGPGDIHVWRGNALAGRLMLRLEEIGAYRRERRGWLPHVTVARFRDRPQLSPAVPDLGSFSPSEVALYHSVLRPAGAQYEILDAVALGG